SAGDFERDALSSLAELFVHHDVVILVGGSGLFVRAVCQGLDDLPKPLPGVRDRLNNLYRQQGLAPLQVLLKQAEPEYSEEMDRASRTRASRARQVRESTGMRFSHFRRAKVAARSLNVLSLGLDTDREPLYQRTKSRVDTMVAAALLNEEKRLRQ